MSWATGPPLHTVRCSQRCSATNSNCYAKCPEIRAHRMPDFAYILGEIYLLSARHRSQTPEWLAGPGIRLQTSETQWTTSTEWITFYFAQLISANSHATENVNGPPPPSTCCRLRPLTELNCGFDIKVDTFRTQIGIFGQFWFDFNGRAVTSRTHTHTVRAIEPGPQLNKCPKMCKLKTFFLFLFHAISRIVWAIYRLNFKPGDMTGCRHSSTIRHSAHALSKRTTRVTWSLISRPIASSSTCNFNDSVACILRLANWLCGSLALSGISFRFGNWKIVWMRFTMCHKAISCANFDVFWHFRR